MKNEIDFAGNIIKIIENSRNNALKKVNEELIQMYWKVGEYLSKEAEKTVFGDDYINSIAKEIQSAFPGIKGFTRRGLYRMKQFYETYAENEKLSPMLREMTPQAEQTFRDNYVMEFIMGSESRPENTLRQALIKNMKDL